MKSSFVGFVMVACIVGGSFGLPAAYQSNKGQERRTLPALSSSYQAASSSPPLQAQSYTAATPHAEASSIHPHSQAEIGTGDHHSATSAGSAHRPPSTSDDHQWNPAGQINPATPHSPPHPSASHQPAPSRSSSEHPSTPALPSTPPKQEEKSSVHLLGGVKPVAPQQSETPRQTQCQPHNALLPAQLHSVVATPSTLPSIVPGKGEALPHTATPSVPGAAHLANGHGKGESPKASLPAQPLTGVPEHQPNGQHQGEVPPHVTHTGGSLGVRPSSIHLGADASVHVVTHTQAPFKPTAALIPPSGSSIEIHVPAAGQGVGRVAAAGSSIGIQGGIKTIGVNAGHGKVSPGLQAGNSAAAGLGLGGVAAAKSTTAASSGGTLVGVKAGATLIDVHAADLSANSHIGAGSSASAAGILGGTTLVRVKAGATPIDVHGADTGLPVGVAGISGGWTLVGVKAGVTPVDGHADLSASSHIITDLPAGAAINLKAKGEVRPIAVGLPVGVGVAAGAAEKASLGIQASTVGASAALAVPTGVAVGADITRSAQVGTPVGAAVGAGLSSTGVAAPVDVGIHIGANAPAGLAIGTGTDVSAAVGLTPFDANVGTIIGANLGALDLGAATSPMGISGGLTL